MAGGTTPSAPLYPDAAADGKPGPGREKIDLKGNECDIFRHTVQNLGL